MNEIGRFVLRMGITGFIIGMVAGNALTIMFGSSEGSFSITAPELSQQFGEAGALLLQTLLSGVMGSVAFAGTFVYHSDRFSITTATLIHMCISFTVLLPVAHILWWTGRTLEGTLYFLILPVVMYVMIWISVYMSYRIEIQRINESLDRRRSANNDDRDHE